MPSTPHEPGFCVGVCNVCVIVTTASPTNCTNALETVSGIHQCHFYFPPGGFCDHQVSREFTFLCARVRRGLSSRRRHIRLCRARRCVDVCNTVCSSRTCSVYISAASFQLRQTHRLDEMLIHGAYVRARLQFRFPLVVHEYLLCSTRVPGQPSP